MLLTQILNCSDKRIIFNFQDRFYLKFWSTSHYTDLKIPLTGLWKIQGPEEAKKGGLKKKQHMKYSNKLSLVEFEMLTESKETNANFIVPRQSSHSVYADAKF